MKIFKPLTPVGAAFGFYIIAIFGSIGVQPTAAAIININAIASNHRDNPFFVPLGPGTYTIDLVGISEGGLYNSYSIWSSTSCSNPDGCPITVPTTSTGWLNSFGVLSSNISSVSIDSTELIPDSNPIGFGVFEDFFSITPTLTGFGVTTGLVYPNSLLALNAAKTVEFTLDLADSVGIYLSDSPGLFGDNRGGLSLNINNITEPPVNVSLPEPTSTLSILTLGALGATLTLKKKRKSSKSSGQGNRT